MSYADCPKPNYRYLVNYFLRSQGEREDFSKWDYEWYMETDLPKIIKWGYENIDKPLDTYFIYTYNPIKNEIKTIIQNEVKERFIQANSVWLNVLEKVTNNRNTMDIALRTIYPEQFD